MSDKNTPRATLKAALRWAGNYGYHVIPYDHTGEYHKDGKPGACTRYRKGPTEEHATTDIDKIIEWWETYPNARPSADLKKSRHLTVDVDGKEGKQGYESLAKWESEYGLLSRETEHHKSRSGQGEHLTYVIPEKYREIDFTSRISPKGFPGLDFCFHLLHLPTSSDDILCDAKPVEAPEHLMEWLVSLSKAVKPSTGVVETPGTYETLSVGRRAFIDEKYLKGTISSLTDELAEDLEPSDSAWNKLSYNFACRVYELSLRYPESPMTLAQADELIDKYWPKDCGWGNWQEPAITATRKSALETVLKHRDAEEWLAFPEGEISQDKPDEGPSKEAYRQELSAAFINDVELGDIEEREFLWEDRIVANSFCLLQGDGGAGKGSFTVWVMSELTHGRLPGVYLGKATKSCFVSSEDSYKKDVKPRLMAQGYREGLIEFIDREKLKTDGTLLLTPMKSEVLIEECAKRGCRLLVLDPVGDFFPDDLNPDNRKDVRKVLRHLQDLGAKHGITIIGIIHENKSNTGVAADKGGGTKAFRDVARSGFRLSIDKNSEGEDVRKASHLKGNYSAQQDSFLYHIEEVWVTRANGEKIKTSKFVMGPSTGETANDIAESQSMSSKDRSFAKKETTKAKVGLIKKLLNAGEDGIEPSDGKLLAEALGVSPTTMRQNALKELIEEGIAENTGSRGKAGKWRIIDTAKAKHYLSEIAKYSTGADKDFGIPM